VEFIFEIDPIEEAQPPISGSGLVLKFPGGPVTSLPRLHVGHSPNNFDAVIVEGLWAQANVSPAKSQECLAFGAVTVELQRGRGFQECLFPACS
jgi:hypothetical protein